MGKGYLLENDFKKAFTKSDMVLRTISLETTISDHMDKWTKKNPKMS